MSQYGVQHDGGIMVANNVGETFKIANTGSCCLSLSRPSQKTLPYLQRLALTRSNTEYMPELSAGKRYVLVDKGPHLPLLELRVDYDIPPEHRYSLDPVTMEQLPAGISEYYFTYNFHTKNAEFVVGSDDILLEDLGIHMKFISQKSCRNSSLKETIFDGLIVDKIYSSASSSVSSSIYVGDELQAINYMPVASVEDAAAIIAHSPENLFMTFKVNIYRSCQYHSEDSSCSKTFSLWSARNTVLSALLCCPCMVMSLLGSAMSPDG